MNIFKHDVKLANVKISTNFFSSSLGLMFRKKMSKYEGLLIMSSSCGVHGCFMCFPIDVVFLSYDLEVVDIAKLYPWKAYNTPYYRHSFILELVSGCVKENGLQIGDILSFRGS